MSDHLTGMFFHLLAAMIAGGLIGLERSYNGHPAGFRTHTLVCMASSVLMLVTIYQQEWFSKALVDTVRIDPPRMAQGIMTGIGFLGAGVIMKEGLSIRGLTTAASIWITAAIGVLAGVGFYTPVLIVSVLTLGTLTAFRWIESKIPTLVYAQCSLHLNCGSPMAEEEMRNILGRHGFEIVHLGYSFKHALGPCFVYEMLIRARGQHRFEALAKTFSHLESVHEFRISLGGN